VSDQELDDMSTLRKERRKQRWIGGVIGFVIGVVFAVVGIATEQTIQQQQQGSTISTNPYHHQMPTRVVFSNVPAAYDCSAFDPDAVFYSYSANPTRGDCVIP
jgi:hypothetical protein